MTIHVVKLAVGADTVEEIAVWQQWQMAQAKANGLPPRPVCGTRSWPKQAESILEGGSLHWVVKGAILVRQRIVEIAPVTDEHGERCGLYLDPVLVRTNPQPKRPFQGWRYLKPTDAPSDLGEVGSADIPDDLRRKLVQLGAW
ncbi:MAG: DUF1489 family protein [Caulobacterales bacterium]|jgi:hypothetical protein